MAYQSKKYRKFVATAATATLVASAVAPAAGFAAEETKEFSDVKGHWGEKAVNYLVGKNAIKGYEDGTFKPDGEITRAEAATVLAGALGLTINEDAKTTLSDAKDHWASKYIAALQAQKPGVINGFPDGTFKPEDKIKRQDMAKMIVAAYPELKLDENAIFSFTDKADYAEAQTAINILASLGVANGKATGKFAPTANVTRAETATFVHRTEVPAERLPVETREAKVVSVSAINAKQVEVKFSREVGTGAGTAANYDVKTVLGTTQNVVLNAAVQADGKTVVLTLTNAYKVATDIVVSVDGIYQKGSIKDQFPKYSTVINVNDTVAPTITSVSSKTNTNAAQVATINFSEPLQAMPTIKVNGTLIAGANLGFNTTSTAVTVSGLNLSVDKVHTLEVLNYSDYADNAVVYTTQNFSVTKDTTAATGKAVVVSDNKVQVTFDKVVNLASLVNVDILRYDTATGEYVKVVLDATTPRSLDATGKVATFTINATEKTNFFGLNDNTESLIVKVKSGVLDSTGNQVTPFEQAVVTTEDVSGPALDAVTYDKNSKGEVTKLYFHFNEALTFEGAGTWTDTSVTPNVTRAALLAANVTVTDLSTNGTVAFADVFGANNIVTVAADGKTLIVQPDTTAASTVTNKLTTGKYSFTLTSGVVKDKSFGTNNNPRASKTADFGAVRNEVTVSSVSINTSPAVDNVLTVNFTKPVTAASAINPANYSINGKALPADTVITFNAANSTEVTFTLPKNTVAKSDGAAVLSVSNVRPQDSSATFKTHVSTINALDNTAPTATATILANGKIQVTFSEAVTVTPADFQSLKINGKVLDAAGSAATATATTLADGTDAVLIELDTEIQDNSGSTGFSYLYIDVDGVAGLDLTKDIVLTQVTGTPLAAWATAIADLNLVNTVEILLPTAPATYDASLLNNAQTGNTIGNKLAGSVIKAK